MTDQPTHYAVPIELMDTVARVLGTMPYGQVEKLMTSLRQCQVVSLGDKPPLEAVKDSS